MARRPAIAVAVYALALKQALHLADSGLKALRELLIYRYILAGINRLGISPTVLPNLFLAYQNGMVAA